MGTRRAKTKEAAAIVETTPYFLNTGAKSGLLAGTFFRIGSRGDYIWDIELLEERLKQLAMADGSQPENVIEYGKLRKIQT
jgi:hypothetical protein